MRCSKVHAKNPYTQRRLQSRLSKLSVGPSLWLMSLHSLNLTYLIFHRNRFRTRSPGADEGPHLWFHGLSFCKLNATIWGWHPCLDLWQHQPMFARKPFNSLYDRTELFFLPYCLKPLPTHSSLYNHSPSCHTTFPVNPSHSTHPPSIVHPAHLISFRDSFGTGALPLP